MNNIRTNIGGAVLAILIFSCNSSAQKSNLSVQEFEKAIGKKNIQILDVRTPGEYQSGHLANARTSPSLYRSGYR